MASTSGLPPPDCNTVYIDTSLNTQFSTYVSSSETVADLQKRVLVEHVKLFPRHGDITINCLKVKRRRNFYPLSESIVVKSLFHWVTKYWYISVDASASASISEEQHNGNMTKEIGTRTKEERGLEEEENINRKRALKNDDVSLLEISPNKYQKISSEDHDMDAEPTQTTPEDHNKKASTITNGETVNNSEQQKSLVEVSELSADSKDHQNDELCLICGDGGELLCCDSCPSTFHLTCLGIKALPEGPWHCKYCFCKICHKRVSSDHNTCVYCCRKFHPSCTNRALTVFCGEKCRKFRRRLDKLGEEHTLEGDTYSWRFICREFNENNDDESNGMRSKLKGALEMMKDGFKPIVDDITGIDMIDQMVYNRGSKLKRLDYSSFFTAILENKDHEIKATATIRIHGNKLAEMPLVATEEEHRGEGMCRRLLTGIEYGLRYLNVEKLVLPAVSNTDKLIWIPKLGFKPVSEDKIKKLFKKYNLVVCHGANILSKSLKEKAKKEDSNFNIKSSRG